MNPEIKKYIKIWAIVMVVTVIVMFVVFFFMWRNYEKQWIAERDYNRTHFVLNGTVVEIPYTGEQINPYELQFKEKANLNTEK